MVSDVQVTSAIDTALDRTIALGYGDVGLHVRRHLPGWPADPPRMGGKVVMATGAASGIGLAACRGFAQLGASVRAVASLRALRSLAGRLSTEEEQLDVLVNNAGTMRDQRERSPNGHTVMFATHVLAPVALTSWLTELLARSAPSWVINVSSGGMYGQSLPAGDFQSEETRYSSKKLYARTKREEAFITELWAEKLAPRRIVVHAMHRRWVDSKGVREWLPVFRAVTGSIIRSPEEGADTIVWLGGAPEALTSTGRFWHGRRARPTYYLLGTSDDDPRDRCRLWDVCQSLIES